MLVLIYFVLFINSFTADVFVLFSLLWDFLRLDLAVRPITEPLFLRFHSLRNFSALLSRVTVCVHDRRLINKTLSEEIIWSRRVGHQRWTESHIRNQRHVTLLTVSRSDESSHTSRCLHFLLLRVKGSWSGVNKSELCREERGEVSHGPVHPEGPHCFPPLLLIRPALQDSTGSKMADMLEWICCLRWMRRFRISQFSRVGLRTAEQESPECESPGVSLFLFVAESRD